MTARHFASPVTTMITRRVRPDRQADYEQWLRGITAVARDFEGHLGVTILGPHGDSPPEYTAIFTFDSATNLKRWMHSDERLQWLARSGDLALDDGDVESLTGLEPWFVLPSRAVTQAPPRYKMALLTALGVYPMLLGVGFALNPLIGSWPQPLRLLLTLVVGIPLMTWGIMPALTRVFFTWLYPPPVRVIPQPAADALQSPHRSSPHLTPEPL